MMAWINSPGGDPCHGERCRLWSKEKNSCGWRCWKGRTGGTCVVVSALVRISATNGCVVLVRFGETDLTDHSRRPHHSPKQTGPDLETHVLGLRDAHPAWGARKLEARLERSGIVPPAASTVHAILRRNDRVTETAGQGAPLTRFEKAAPNLLWQMDFKGWVKLTNGTRCHPLTVVDDHSRYLVNLTACANQTEETVRGHLETAFRHHGLPEAMFVDNGSPWGGGPGERWTHFGVWLLKLGVRVLHSRPYHPQSRGKNERFHRTLNKEVLSLTRFAG